MTHSLDRRGFLRRLSGLDGASGSAPVATEFSIDWLGSEDAALAQLSEARPFLMEDAARAGIDTAGKSELEILRALLSRSQPPPARDEAAVPVCETCETRRTS